MHGIGRRYDINIISSNTNGASYNFGKI